MLKLFFLAFLILPFVEIYLLIQVGQSIGAWPTVGIVVLMALIGAFIFKTQGFMTWRRVQGALAEGRLPAMEMLEGVVILMCGAMFLAPGFFTDAIGIIVLLPPVRRAIIQAVLKRVQIVPMGAARTSSFNASYQRSAPPNTAKRPDVIEGEFRRDE